MAERRALKEGDTVVLARDVPTLGRTYPAGSRVRVRAVSQEPGDRVANVEVIGVGGHISCLPVKALRWAAKEEPGEANEPGGVRGKAPQADGGKGA